MFRTLAAVLLSLCFYASAYAVPVTVQFTVENFHPLNYPTPSAPQSTVTGTIVYEATGAYDPIQSITSIDMTIAGHSYTVGELAWISPFGATGSSIIGGSSWGADAMDYGADDFYIDWRYSTPQFFQYIARDIRNGYGGTITSFSVSVPYVGPPPVDDTVPVPEPSTMLLLTLGLIGTFAASRRRKI